TAVPVTVEVLDWTMPATSSLPSAFYMQYDFGRSGLCAGHVPGKVNCDGDVTMLRTLHSLYARMALENRMTIANGSGLNAAQAPSGAYASGDWETLYESPVIRGDTVVPAGAGWRLPMPRQTVVSQFAYTPDHCDATCADQWEAE